MENPLLKLSFRCRRRLYALTVSPPTQPIFTALDVACRLEAALSALMGCTFASVPELAKETGRIHWHALLYIPGRPELTRDTVKTAMEGVAFVDIQKLSTQLDLNRWCAYCHKDYKKNMIILNGQQIVLKNWLYHGDKLEHMSRMVPITQQIKTREKTD